MMRLGVWRAVVAVALAGLLLTVQGSAQTGKAARPAVAKVAVKFEALAETRLLMEGLAHSNYRSLNRLLEKKPADNDTWVFARGQALLVAETGNLLLLRPPRNSGRDVWMQRAMEMRQVAGNLARAAAARDYPRSKTVLTELTTACNRCHGTFRVPVRVAPEPEGSGKEGRATAVSLVDR
jgi:hypothetical protein